MKRSAIRHILASLTALIVAVTLTGCHSSRKATATGHDTYHRSGQTSASAKIKHPESASAKALIREAESWLGTPYKYGGTDRDGVDCSGLVLRVYKDALGIGLPRNSRAQRDFCPWVASDALYPGDLLFFSSDSNRDRVTHVGIFVGDNRMIHASSSSGVIVTDITSSYYKRNYMGGGQVEQYHAMLGNQVKKSKKKAVEPTEPDIAQTPSPKPGEIHISQLESPTGFSLTPVDNLPTRAAKSTVAESSKTSSPKSKQSYQSSKSTTPTATSVAKSDTKNRSENKAAKAAASTAMSPDEARAAVLGSLPEQKLSDNQ